MDGEAQGKAMGAPDDRAARRRDADTVGPRRRADARRTREQIVTAAAELIAGRRTLSMSGLARAASVSRPTLYAHFARVEDVIEAAVGRTLHGVEESTREVEASDLPAPERLERLLRTRWQSLAEHAEAYRLATVELTPGRMEELHAGTHGPLALLVEEGKEAGAFRTDLPTGWLVAVIHGVLHQAAEEALAGRITEDEAADLLSRTALATLGGR